MSDSSQRLSSLSPEKQALLLQRLQKKLGANRKPPLRPCSRGSSSFPLSFAQQRLWFLDQLVAGNASYNIPSGVRLRGALDVSALERCLAELLRRHEALRTTFQAEEGRPVQVISLPPATVTLPVVELSALPEEERETEARRLAVEEARRPFDLVRGPLLRVVLLRLGAEEHLLLLTMHHIVSDGWSMTVLIRELGALYQAFRAGQASPLPPLPVQYVDYALWQREWLQGEALEAQLAYWRKRLAGTPQVLELPLDRPRPAVQTHRGARLPVQLSQALSDALRELASREGATPFMVLLSAFLVLLHRYSGQSDICVGSPVAGRGRPELEGLIGFFVNTLVLRAQPSGDMSFRALLGRVREGVLEALSQQDVPFEKLVEELRPERNLSHPPLFQVVFALQNDRGQAMEAPGLVLRPMEVGTGSAAFDLNLDLVDGGGGFTGALEYNTDLFDAGTTARMLGHLRMLLEGIVSQPEQRLAELSLLPEAERRRLLVDWNDTRADYPHDACLHELIEAQAARTPEAVAVASAGRSLTYRELDARANRLAQHLRSLGVGPESRVAVCLERSPELLVALLAILKAGGAYVPLDASYPASRLAFMLEDSAARLLLTEQHLLSRLPAHSGHVVRVDSGAPAIEQHAPAPPPRAASPENLAYVIYTSGSTGRPKGVMVPHRTAANFFAAMDSLLDGASPGCWLAVTSISFDISVLELLWTLARGFEVVLHDEQAASRTGTAASLHELVRRHRVTHVQCTPSFARGLLLSPEVLSGLGGLRHLLVGGEALPGPLARELRAALPSAALTNMYGPTETTIWSSLHPVRAEALPATVSIGAPIANTRMYVLDAHLQPCPVGVPGELFIAGEGVVRGYLERPELTAERFLPEPFGPAGCRMYRTGDKARWSPDGTLEFLGRLDEQVKLRGFRIELGEVEAALSEHPGVSEAAVVVREVAPGDTRLVAYVAARTAPPPAAAELRAALQARLPEYMVPAVFVVLDALPKTPNGKVNRKALPTPDTSLLAQRRHVPPRTEAEQKLAAIWAEVLRVEQVGADDDFFALGGHSLVGLRMVALARKAGLYLEAQQLFKHPKLADLAAVAVVSPPSSPPVAANEHAGEEDLPFSPNQRWYLETFDLENHVWAMTLLWDAPPGLEPELLRASTAFVFEHHDVFRLRVYRREDGWAQRRLSSAGTPHVEVLELCGLAPAAQREAILEAGRRLQSLMNVLRGPVLAFALCRPGGGASDKLIICIHHSVYDAYSLEVLFGDLLSASQQLAARQPPRLPPVPTRYRQYLLAVESYGHSPAMEQARAFWLDERRLRPVEPLPVDMPGGRHTDLNSRRHTVFLPAELLERMPAWLRAHPEANLNEVLLYGLARAYVRWAGTRALRLDLEHNGRTDVLPGLDLSRTVGPTTVKLPVLFELEDGEPPAEAFARVRRTVREALAHALGYGLLRYGRDEAARRRLAACGAPQVFFNNRGMTLGRAAPASAYGSGEALVFPRLDGGESPVSYDLMVECDNMPEGPALTWVYSSALHREETLRALASDMLAHILALTGEP